MLRIYFGEMENVAYGPIWFQDPFVQKMIHEVDHTDYIGGVAFDSPVLGVIPPEKLSGGVKH